MSGRNPVSHYRGGQVLAGLGCGSVAAAFVFFGLLSAAGGASELAQATKYREPVKLTYAQFVKQHPTEGWYHLTKTALEVPGARWTSIENRRLHTETVSEIFVPVMSTTEAEEDDKPQIHLILSTTDKSIENTLTGLNSLKDGEPKGKVVEYITKHFKELYPERDIEGMVKPISGLDSEHRKSFEEDGLTHDAVILKEGEKPNEGSGHAMQGFGTFMMIVAAVAGLIGVWFIVQMQKDLKQITG